MFILNKVAASRRVSREFGSGDCVDSPNDMENIPFKPQHERRQSRMKSFFGAVVATSMRRNSLDVPPQNGLTVAFSRPELNNSSTGLALHSGRRRRLRRFGSKGSLSSISSIAFAESLFEERTKSRITSDPLAKYSTSPSLNQSDTTRISSPFNFTHLVQVNPRDASRLQEEAAQDAGEQWNRALHRESQSRPSTAYVVNASSHLRSLSVETVRSRNRSDSAVSAAESFTDTNRPPSPKLAGPHACPITPPLRTSSRQCLKILEAPEDDIPCITLGSTERSMKDAEIFDHAIPTMGHQYSGLKSYGVENDSSPSSPPSIASRREAVVPLIPVIEEEPSWVTGLLEPPRNPDRIKRKSLSVRTRPLSQLSQYSDTLNSNFIPGSPNRPFSLLRSRCAPSRLSAHFMMQGTFNSDPLAIDSWEEDIDWCYEHEVEADCDFDWDKSVCATNTSGEDATGPKLASRNPVLKVTDETKRTTIILEKRITGLFEDRLLLPPPSPMSMNLPGFSGSELGGIENMFPLTNSDLKHESTSSPTSLSDLTPGKSYREELCLVAQQLDEHIASLNSGRIESPASIHSGNRSRADSQATCVTLCSESETVAPVESNEAITPTSSAHSSFHFTKNQSSSIAGSGFTVEGCLAKDFCIPAAIPGVIELAPNGLDTYSHEDVEFVHYI